MNQTKLNKPNQIIFQFFRFEPICSPLKLNHKQKNCSEKKKFEKKEGTMHLNASKEISIKLSFILTKNVNHQKRKKMVIKLKTIETIDWKAWEQVTVFWSHWTTIDQSFSKKNKCIRPTSNKEIIFKIILTKKRKR